MVYHYTTIETLYSILSSYKTSNDKGYFNFWASNILDQNDKEELSFGCKELHEAIIKLEREKENNGETISTERLSNMFSWSFLIGKTQDEVVDEIDNSIKEMYPPFTISFSRQEDTLLMWSIYANKGNGICLAFEENELSNLKTDLLYISDDIIYDKEIVKYVEILKLHYDEYLKIFENDRSFILNRIIYEGRLAYKVMLESISPFIKNKAFEDEKEWRIALFKNHNTNTCSRITSNLNIINYVNVGIPVDALKKIVIGPCPAFCCTVNLLDCPFFMLLPLSVQR